MLTLVSKDSVKNSDHFDVLCVLIACMVLEILNQMSKNQKSSLIVWNTVLQITTNQVLHPSHCTLVVVNVARGFHPCIATQYAVAIPKSLQS